MSPHGKQGPIGALVPFEGDASVRLEGIDMAFTVPVVALSLEALLVRAPESSPAGSLVHIELTTGSDLVQGMGEVAGVRPVADGHELLIQLLYVDAQSRSVLQRLVSESEGETTVEWATGPTSPSVAAAPAGERPEPGAPEPSHEGEGPAAVPSEEPSREESIARAPTAPSPELPESSERPEVPELPESSERPEAPELPESFEPPESPEASPGEAISTPPAQAGVAVPDIAEEPSPVWTLDPVDPTEVAAVDLETAAASPKASQQADEVEPPWTPAVEAGLPPPSRWAESGVSGEVDPAALAEPTPHEPAGVYGYGMSEIEAHRKSSRTWLLPAALLVVIFLSAAWWTRDAWLGGGETPVSEAEADDSSPGPPSPDAALDPAAVDAAGREPSDVGAERAPESGDEGTLGEQAVTEVESPPVREPEAVAPSGPVEILGVDIRRGRGETLVTVSLSGPLEGSAISSFGLVRPPRFVVKLLGVSDSGFYAADTPELARVRIGIHEGAGGVPETHMVFDLATLGATGSVSASGSTLVVRLTGR